MNDQALSQDQDAWVFTDLDGRIETVSMAARQLFGAASPGRGDDLLECFPLPRKALLFDIDVALTGWPAQRSVVIRHTDGRPVTMQYRVSRRFEKSDSGGGLYWRLRASKS